MSDTEKYQKKVLKKTQESISKINESINTLFESVKGSYAEDLSYVASKLEEINNFILSKDKNKFIAETVNVNADMRNKVNNVIIKYQSKKISEELIGDFFNDCYNVLNIGFHPDENFIDYVGVGGKRCFTKPEAQQLENILTSMFEWCDARKIDIYEIGMNNHPMRQELNNVNELEEIADPEILADRNEIENSLLDETSIEDSEDYRRAYDEFMKWENNNDPLTRQAAHEYAMSFVEQSNEDYNLDNF